MRQTSMVRYRRNTFHLIHGAAIGTAAAGPFAYLLTQTTVVQHAALWVWWAAVLPSLPVAWTLVATVLPIFAICVVALWLVKPSLKP